MSNFYKIFSMAIRSTGWKETMKSFWFLIDIWLQMNKVDQALQQLKWEIRDEDRKVFD